MGHDICCKKSSVLKSEFKAQITLHRSLLFLISKAASVMQSYIRNHCALLFCLHSFAEQNN